MEANSTHTSLPSTPRPHQSNSPFYRQFLPAQLTSISANDPIPSVDDLSALHRHLVRLKSEAKARLNRIEGQKAEPLKPLFPGNSYDLFAPSTSADGLAASSLYAADQRQRSTSAGAKQKSKERAFNLTSPSGAHSQSNGLHGSPAPPGRPRIKVKRERDTESIPAATPSALGSDVSAKARRGSASVEREERSGSQIIKLKKASDRNRAGSMDRDDDSAATTDLDPDWDLDEDSLPSRPGRTYGRNKKRKRKESERDSLDEDSASDLDAASTPLGAGSSRIAAGGTGASKVGATGSNGLARATLVSNAGSRRGSEIAGGGAGGGSKAANFAMRLKASPATGAAFGTPGAASTNALKSKHAESPLPSVSRRNNSFASPSSVPSTPAGIQAPGLVVPIGGSVPPCSPALPVAGWEMPAKTPQSFIPALQPSRAPRYYPTKPVEVNEDFANKDWKERERERDRLLERESAGPGTPGPGAGQSLVKEATATAGRRGGRDQQQTPINTFYNYADAFFKTLTEDDLAWLSSKSDDTEPFQMPPLGKHFRKVWEEEDALLASGAYDAYGTPLVVDRSRTPSATAFTLGGGGLPLASPIPDATSANAEGAVANGKAKAQGHPELELPPAPNFDPRLISDEHLGLGPSAAVDARGGPLTERLVSAILPDGNVGGLGLPSHVVEEAMDDDELGSEDAEGEPDDLFDDVYRRQDMADFEERIKRELKAIDVLGADEELDWSTRCDDEISSTLRQVQRALSKQQKINDLRKARLFDIAMDRMAYQDYVGCLNSVEKEIEAGWNKRLRQIRASLGKKKKGGNQSNSAAANQEGGGGSPPPASGGNGTSQANGSATPNVHYGPNGNVISAAQALANLNGPSKPQLPDTVLAAMERREKLKYAFEEMFDNARHAWCTPKESVYADLELDKIE
ncbi:hypothetical protein IE53DRAFT_368143 [Violaceomyces palustris]|uniref:Uncharacterized protein n=1 Tax=Violaceomyces palustris TaxID=1673888 RepID=A0ACD0NZR9_9BASI|nr:hypothetical protein IE53DRAFT_368143 [Violaceomyces palustris]